MDLLSKLSDVKNIHDLSTILAFPLCLAAYISQSNWNININDSTYLSIATDFSITKTMFYVLLIIIIKAIYLGLITGFIHAAIIFINILIKNNISPVISLFCFTFAFIIPFNIQLPTQIPKPNDLWAYACFVVGFYFLRFKSPFDL